MKKIGLVGGMTPESTSAYYEMIIDLGRERFANPLHNPVVLIYSIDLAEIAAHQNVGREDRVVELLIDVLEKLRVAGAEVGALTVALRETYLEICRRHMEANAVEAVILGCTEIPLVLKAEDLQIPLIDTAKCHARAIFEQASQA